MLFNWRNRYPGEQNLTEAFEAVLAEAAATNSALAATIELKKEIEPSATKASLVTLTGVFEAKAKTAVKVKVNKIVVAEINPGEPATASSHSLGSFVVGAGQKYEVTEATLLKEALASVATL